MAKDKITARAIDSLRRRAARGGLPIFLWDTECKASAPRRGLADKSHG